MAEEKRGGVRGWHVFCGILALGVVGVLVWVIELARQGDPVGYMILSWAGALISLAVLGLMIGLILRLALKVQAQSQPPTTAPIKDLYDTQRVLLQQNRALRQLADNQGGRPAWPVGLPPGQEVTPEGYVINRQVFTGLDED